MPENSLRLVATFEGRLREVEANNSLRFLAIEKRLDLHARALRQLREVTDSHGRQTRRLFAEVSTLRGGRAEQLDLWEAL